jgi:hypothetical protein
LYHPARHVNADNARHHFWQASGRGIAFFFFELYKPNHGNKGNSAVDEPGQHFQTFRVCNVE